MKPYKSTLDYNSRSTRRGGAWGWILARKLALAEEGRQCLVPIGLCKYQRASSMALSEGQPSRVINWDEALASLFSIVSVVPVIEPLPFKRH